MRKKNDNKNEQKSPWRLRLMCYSWSGINQDATLRTGTRPV